MKVGGRGVGDLDFSLEPQSSSHTFSILRNTTHTLNGQSSILAGLLNNY